MADTVDDARFFWKARTNNGHFRFGLNAAAREEFGEISRISFSNTQKELHDGEEFIEIDSPNIVSDTITLRFPESGRVVAFHTELLYKPSLINSADREDNWIVELN